MTETVVMAKNSGKDEPTKEELYEEAQEQDVEGRSDMTKSELADAVGKTLPGDLTPLAQYRRDTRGDVPAS